MNMIDHWFQFLMLTLSHQINSAGRQRILGAQTGVVEPPIAFPIPPTAELFHLLVLVLGFSIATLIKNVNIRRWIEVQFQFFSFSVSPTLCFLCFSVSATLLGLLWSLTINLLFFFIWFWFHNCVSYFLLLFHSEFVRDIIGLP